MKDFYAIKQRFEKRAKGLITGLRREMAKGKNNQNCTNNSKITFQIV